LQQPSPIPNGSYNSPGSVGPPQGASKKSKQGSRPASRDHVMYPPPPQSAGAAAAGQGGPPPQMQPMQNPAIMGLRMDGPPASPASPAHGWYNSQRLISPSMSSNHTGYPSFGYDNNDTKGYKELLYNMHPEDSPNGSNHYLKANRMAAVNDANQGCVNSARCVSFPSTSSGFIQPATVSADEVSSDSNSSAHNRPTITYAPNNLMVTSSQTNMQNSAGEWFATPRSAASLSCIDNKTERISPQYVQQHAVISPYYRNMSLSNSSFKPVKSNSFDSSSNSDELKLLASDKISSSTSRISDNPNHNAASLYQTAVSDHRRFSLPHQYPSQSVLNVNCQQQNPSAFNPKSGIEYHR
uniref:AT-rich interactive domain-containing protein 1B n=1 Tax=Anisakis simplex TaxID=6269 RepID=A0A0M3KC17_ANISI